MIIAAHVAPDATVPFARGPCILAHAEGYQIGAFWEGCVPRGPLLTERDYRRLLRDGDAALLPAPVRPQHRTGAWWFGNRSVRGVLGDLGLGPADAQPYGVSAGCLLLVQEADPGIRAARDRLVVSTVDKGVVALREGKPRSAAKLLRFAHLFSRRPDARILAPLALTWELLGYAMTARTLVDTALRELPASEAAAYAGRRREVLALLPRRCADRVFETYVECAA